MHDGDALRTASGGSPLLIRNRVRAQGWQSRWHPTAKRRRVQAVDAQVLKLRYTAHANWLVGGRGARCRGFAVLHRGILSAARGALRFLRTVETEATRQRQVTHSTTHPTVLSASSPTEVDALVGPAKIGVFEIGIRCIT